MANKQIKDLTPVTSITDDDVLHVNIAQSSADRKITFLNLETFFLNRNRANNTEAITGVDDGNFMTPLKTKAQLDSRLATEIQAVNGTNNTSLMTALRTVQSIKQQTPEISTNDNSDLISSASTVQVNRKYHITVTNTVTLPSTTGLSVGDGVRLTKQIPVTPTITVNGGNSEVITLANGGTDTSILFDIDSEIILIFNGTNWEV